MARTSVTYAYAADIVKAERDTDGNLMVYGKATGPDLDLDGQVCDPTWLKSAMPDWFEWGNVREQHGPVAAGVGVELTETGGNDWMLLSKCVDPNTANKIENDVLKGYSVGINDAKVIKDARAPGGRIVGGKIVEISYVDRPCNPTAKMAIAKSAGLSDDGAELEAEEGADLALQPVDASAEVATIAEPELTPVIEAEVKLDGKAIHEAIVKTAPGSGRSASLAKTLGADITRRVTKLVGADLLAKAAADDIASAQDAALAIARLIQSEASGLAAGNMCEASQISTLLCAIDALAYFQCMEAAEPAPVGGGDDDDVETGMAAVSTAQTSDMDMNGNVALLAAEADTIKSDSTADQIQAAVTKAMKAHEEELSTLRAELARVKATPVPGGPVLARPRADIAKAEERGSALAEADRFERQALRFDGVDALAAAGYRARAAELRAGAVASVSTTP